jgi:hypothetical protein
MFLAFAFFVAAEFLGLTIYGYLSPGQVGSFASPEFTVAFLMTNTVAILLVSLVLYADWRIRRGVRK